MVKLVGQDPAVSKRITCLKCGGINEYLPNDIRTLWEGTDIGGGPDGAKGFSCAQCGKDVIISRW